MKLGSTLLFSTKVLVLGAVMIVSGLLGICIGLAAVSGLFFHPLVAVLVATGPLFITYVAYRSIKQLLEDPWRRMEYPKVSNAEAVRKIL